MNTEASNALSEATEAIKTRNVELKRLNEQNGKLRPLIEKNISANTQLFGTLTEVNKVTKALTQDIEQFNDGKAGLEPLREVVDKMINTVQFTVNALREAQNAHYEYQQAKNKNRR